MKKIVLSAVTLLSSLTIATLVYGEPVSVDCASSLKFGEDKCEVCYTDSFEAQETANGWTSTIANVKIPWKHAGGALDEIIYNIEQKYPEIHTTLGFSTKPKKSEELWINHETLVWIPMVDHQEYVLKKGEEVGIYKLAQNASIKIEGTKPDDAFMIFFPLVVRDFDAKTNQDSEPKTRNVCVEGKFTIKKNTQTNTTGTLTGSTLGSTLPQEGATDVAAVNNPTEETLGTIENTSTQNPTLETNTSGNAADSQNIVSGEMNIDGLPPLNSAGEEETETITKDQTKTQTGPTLWIVLALAFAFSSAWNAWRKQKV